MSSMDFMPIKGYDHVEFYVGNAKQAAHFYDKTFGFKPVAKMGLETGCRDRASYVMQQGKVRFVFTSALGPDHEIARHCALHGDGVKVIALEVPDCDAAVREAKSRGATVIERSTALEEMLRNSIQSGVPPRSSTRVETLNATTSDNSTGSAAPPTAS